ncbi:hypothetical protein INT46_010401 [Mucor plumbeus]|uniref:Uncharacterized protein n=1 Tax=Mucor plumbeus TaxID=97098 RepID=A0A8H7QK52_9FUNG|nr:hypothetical protein INT46_010401 [Mucor plumbeus]
MDIGNLPIFNGQNNKSTNNTPVNTSRSFDSKNTPTQAEEKSAWEQIGDYDQPASNTTNAIDDDEEEENHEQVQIPRKHVNSSKEKKESDDAASIASEAAVKATQQHNITK